MENWAASPLKLQDFPNLQNHQNNLKQPQYIYIKTLLTTQGDFLYHSIALNPSLSHFALKNPKYSNLRKRAQIKIPIHGSCRRS